MVDEAQKYKEEDEILRNRIEKRNAYESSLYGAKSLAENNPELKDFIEKEIEWIGVNQEASAQEYQERLDAFTERVKSAMPQAPPEASTSDDGPKVEEID